MKAKPSSLNFLFPLTIFTLCTPTLNAQDLQDHSIVRIDPLQQSLHYEANDFGIARTYSSQSNFTGIFGVGWCSELDVRVEVYVDQSYRLRGCDPHDGRSLDPRAAGSGLRKTASGFERTRADEAREVFSAQGDLLRIDNRTHGRIEVRRSTQVERPSWAVRVGEQRELRIDFNGEGRVQRWDAIQFTYQADELIGWHHAGRERVEISYHRWSNLRRWSRWTRTHRETGQIEYDLTRDEVKSFVREVGSGRQELRIRRSPNSKESEKILEWKRGSEANPARILYDMKSGPMEVRGSARDLESLLDQIREPQSLAPKPETTRPETTRPESPQHESQKTNPSPLITRKEF